ncbi:MAG: hypothetical protein KDJ99_19675, partial [Candidatus Competibacteraceae bacterium]|nr:hypothetical protein [Candidatus Competibacteraceae bacterium]
APLKLVMLRTGGVLVCATTDAVSGNGVAQLARPRNEPTRRSNGSRLPATPIDNIDDIPRNHGDLFSYRRLAWARRIDTVDVQITTGAKRRRCIRRPVFAHQPVALGNGFVNLDLKSGMQSAGLVVLLGAYRSCHCKSDRTS